MAVMTLIAALLSLAAAEFLLLRFHPQQYMMPRYRPSPRYGIELPAGQEIVHGVFGRWEYRYTINEFGYRGDAVPISMAYSTPNIVVLGDSNTMGNGVNDGEEYPAVMDRHLAGRFNVVNLGVSGYGLTQQIRYFVEFGQLFDPDIVVIQFASNDPGDNLFDPVTRIENGSLFSIPRTRSGLD